MTSANFATVMLDSIVIDRQGRQRKQLEKIDELAESISLTGLINPPVVTNEHVLVAGERRVTACRQLGWTSIPVQYAHDLDPVTLHLIELEENVKRVDLAWQDHIDAVTQYHKIRLGADNEWTKSKTAEALGVSPALVTNQLQVAEAIATNVSGVVDAPKYSTALGITKRNVERKNTSANVTMDTFVKESMGITEPLTQAEAKPADPDRPVLLECGNSLQFFEAVQRVPYNLIHCDFPYGVNAGDKQGQSAAKGFGEYDDSFETYITLLNSFCNNVENFSAPSAHLIFWFSMDFYELTKVTLGEAGWSVNPFPLVWHKSNNQGILPDSNRGPRRIYETAFLASRGDRKVVRAVSNVASFPVTKENHQAEKPKPMLEHFFKMLVDESTRLLDPTAGSGNAIAVAEELGAQFSHGIELSEEYHARSKLNLGV